LSPTGFDFGPIVIPPVHKWFTQTINDKTIPILFADDTSLLVTRPNYNDFHVNIKTAFHCINEWFKLSQLTINLNKTHRTQFTASKNNSRTKIKIAYDNKQITTISNIKFLAIRMDDKMSWKWHIEHISSKLSAVCYIIKSTKPYTSMKTLKMVYHSYFNSIINYGLLFWDN
jgi:hypothetical protein